MGLVGNLVYPVHRYLDLEFLWNGVQAPAEGGTWVYWVLALRAGEFGRIDAIYGSDWSVEIDGQVFSGRTDITVGANEGKELASGKAFVKQENFRQREFGFSFSQMLNITYEGQYIGRVSASGVGILDAIDPNGGPVLDKDAVFLGETLRITPRGPYGALYRLGFAMGGAEGTIAEAAAGAVEWVVPEDLGRQIPYTDRGTLRILCQAFLDGEPVGREREAVVTALVPESAVPVVEEFFWEDLSPASSLGVPVQNVSRLQAEAFCQGAMGSQVARIQVSLGGQPLGPVTGAGDQEILVTVTDTRGRVGRYREALFVVPYEAPRVKISAHRCLEDGTAEDTGGFARICLEADVTYLGSDPAAWMKLGQETVWEGAFSGQAQGKVLGDRLTGLRMEAVVPADGEQAHGVGGSVTDGLLTAEHTVALSVAYCTLDLLRGGKGVAFGTVAREPGFLCAMDAKFTGKVILPDGSDLMERLGK